VSSRDRRRAERQKRKTRSTERRAQIAARYEQKNQAARAALEPLQEDERPAVVTVGAVLSGLLAASILIGYAARIDVNGDRPRILQVILPAMLMGVMSYGLWRARYWAVLGFQAILALLILAAALGLVGAGSGAKVAANLGLLAIAGTLFYFMIKALARIQMPEREPRD
jgi:peptidoglycan/LPS O-acetylase OafA/YrhL